MEVDWVNGAFLMVKKSAIEKAGLLDEDFFLYAEEIEWCSRLRKTGKMCIYGDLHVIHMMGVTANQVFKSASAGYKELGDKKGYQLILSGLVRVRKQFGAGWFLFHFAAYLFTIPFYLIVVLFRNIFFLPHANFQWKEWWGFTKNVVGIFPFLSRILGNKPTFYKVL
ncbi:glycosyltransferase family 2 protein [Ferruginibacter sp.]